MSVAVFSLKARNVCELARHAVWNSKWMSKLKKTDKRQYETVFGRSYVREVKSKILESMVNLLVGQKKKTKKRVKV